MNRLFKKHFWLTAMVISMAVPAAYADDLFDDSFFADPAPVDAVKPADPAPAAAQESTEKQPSPAPTEPAPALPSVADASLPAEPAAEPQLSMDFPAPSADLNVPPPPSNNAPSSGSDFNFGSSNSGNMSMSVPPSEQVLGKVSSDIFREMAEMERENSALMLQLKREQLRSEIDALKTSNRQTLFDEIERREKMTQARLEWELAQDLKRQDALERKRKSEIRQKQIEAALKREEDRRIQKMKDEENARIQKQKEEKIEADRRKNELRKKYDAASLVQVKGLQPVLMAATRPAKVKRSASSRVSVQLTSSGQEMLAMKKAGTSLPAAESVDEKDVVKENREPASSIYTVAEIRGTAGTLIAKLISKKDKTTFFAKHSTILPTGHVVTKIDKDYVLVQIGKDQEMIGFPSAGLLSDSFRTTSEKTEGESSNTGILPPQPQKQIIPPITVSKGSGPMLSGASMAR